MTTVKPAVAAKVKAAVVKVLAEQYGPEAVFDPIVVVPRDDGDGEVYLQVYIVYDESAVKTEVDKRLQFHLLLDEELGEDMSPPVITKSYIPKSEWAEFSRSPYVVSP